MSLVYLSLVDRIERRPCCDSLTVSVGVSVVFGTEMTGC